MSLIKEIQDVAIDSTVDISILLRKCKVLAANLPGYKFRKWVDNELNGYKSVDDLPSYRILRVDSYGDFSGPFNSGARNAPIPLLSLPKEIKEDLSKAYLMEPIISYVSLIDNKEKKKNFREPWSPDIIALLSKSFYHTEHCVSAWKLIPYNAIEAVIDTIRNKVLDFVLDLKKEAPGMDKENPNSENLSEEKVNKIFNNYISGDVQNLVQGSSNFSQVGNITINKGDLESLKNHLRSMKLEEGDLNELEVAIKSDPQPETCEKFGEKVSGWLGKMYTKASNGAWGISIAAAGGILTNAISKYYGLI